MRILFNGILKSLDQILSNLTEFKFFQLLCNLVKFCELCKFLEQILNVFAYVFEIDILESFSEILDRTRVFGIRDKFLNCFRRSFYSIPNFIKGFVYATFIDKFHF